MKIIMKVIRKKFHRKILLADPWSIVFGPFNWFIYTLNLFLLSKNYIFNTK
jgi:hypothetical protein